MAAKSEQKTEQAAGEAQAVLNRIIWLAGLILFCATSGCQNNRPVMITMAPTSTTISHISDSNNSEPHYDGVPISQWIDKRALLNAQGLSLQDLLTLNQLSDPDEWGVINFELPINYDALKANGGNLHLGSLNRDGDFVECYLDGYERATNGHCLTWWNINWDRPGMHLVRARLICYNHHDTIHLIGPGLPVCSSNACRLLGGTTMFDSTNALFEAKLREPIATFSIEAQTIEGRHIRTFNGKTTNGVVDVEWNLVDEHGMVFSGSSFDGVFHISYPGDTSTNAPAKTRFTKFHH